MIAVIIVIIIILIIVGSGIAAYFLYFKKKNSPDDSNTNNKSINNTNASISNNGLIYEEDEEESIQPNNTPFSTKPILTNSPNNTPISENSLKNTPMFTNPMNNTPIFTNSIITPILSCDKTKCNAVIKNWMIDKNWAFDTENFAVCKNCHPKVKYTSRVGGLSYSTDNGNSWNICGTRNSCFDKVTSLYE